MRHIYLPIVIAFTFQISSFSQSPLILVTPDSLSENLQTGGISTQTLSIANNGTSNLNFEIAFGYSPPENYQNFALQFDGVDDFVEVLNHPSLQIENNITIESWINFESGGTYQPRIVAKGPDGQGYEMLLADTSPEPNIEFRINPGQLISQTSLVAGDWYHVAFTYDGSFIKVYIDGDLDTFEAASGNLNVSNINLFIGQNTNWSDKYKGVIEEVRIWNVARSQTQIQQNMYRELPEIPPGLVGYWRFNEGIGDTTFDKTFNGNNGVLQNGVEWMTSTAPIVPSWLSMNLLSGTVTPGSSIEIDVNFDASGMEGGNYNMFITISSNDTVNPEIVVPVNLQVTSAPDIVISEDSLDYGEVFIGDSVTNSFLIYNYGFELLTVSNISSNNPDYTVNISNFNLDPGESQEVEVTFVPNSVGSSPGILTISSNDPYEPTLTVDLSGIGLEPPVISITPASFNESLLTGGTSTQLLTISNNGNSNLTFNIGLTYTSPAEFQNMALQCDGIDDYVNILDNQSLQLPTQFTVEAWGNLSSFPASPLDHVPIIWRGNNIGWGNDYHFRIAQAESWGPGAITVGSGGQNGGEYCFSGGFITTNEWYHYAYVVNGDSLFAYLNGELVGSSSGVSPYSIFGYETYIGYANRNGVDIYTEGMFDEIRIWNVARTQTEIQENMYSELPGILPGLVGYWQFNEGTGDTTFDKTPNRNNGTLHNGIQWVASTAPISPIWVSVNPYSGLVIPGSSIDIDVNFDAAGLEGGEYEVQIIVYSNDPITPEVVIPVHLDVTSAPDLTVSEDNLNFGGVFIGGNKTKQLVVYNYGFETLSVTDITSSNTNYFVNYTNFTLEPGGNKTVNVTYIPATVGSDPGILTIHSNDPYEPEYIINLQGEGLDAPIVNVAPDSLSVILESDSSVTEVLTVSNTGGNQLEFEIDIENIPVSLGKYSFIPLMTEDRAIATNEKRYNKNFSPVRASILHKSSNVNQPDIMFYEGINVLLITSGIYPSEIKNLLLSYSDINTVDVFDAYQSTPTLSQLVAYNSIIVMNNYPFGDPATLGDVLADYVDAGGGVILTLAAFVTDWEIKGRLSNEDYLPFNVGPGPLGSASLGNYNPNHAIMEGVTDAAGELLADVTLASGAELVAEWDNNYPFIATRGPMVAAINVFITNSGFWSGDIPLIIYNSVKWCGGWLSAEPKSGIISSGSHININMTFGTAGMNEGDYYADIIFLSNDPLTPVMAIPAHMYIESPTGIKEENIIPAEYSLYQNFPNPFNPVTTIKFDLPEKSEVVLNIYNILGEKVKTIINKEIEAGSHKVQWDARSVGSGVYIYRIKAGDYIQTKKMVYLK